MIYLASLSCSLVDDLLVLLKNYGLVLANHHHTKEEIFQNREPMSLEQSLTEFRYL